MKYDHGDIETIKMLSKGTLHGIISGILKHGAYASPDEKIIFTISEYLFKIANGEGINLKSQKNFSITKHFADKEGAIQILTIQDILFTSGLTENIEYWSKKINSLNKIEYCDHSDGFQDIPT